jgi:hypothetical protein
VPAYAGSASAPSRDFDDPAYPVRGSTALEGDILVVDEAVEGIGALGAFLQVRFLGL